MENVLLGGRVKALSLASSIGEWKVRSVNEVLLKVEMCAQVSILQAIKLCGDALQLVEGQEDFSGQVGYETLKKIGSGRKV
jgi:hypothetical protein